jgi:hypothetical protein
MTEAPKAFKFYFSILLQQPFFNVHHSIQAIEYKSLAEDIKSFNWLNNYYLEAH